MNPLYNEKLSPQLATTTTNLRLLFGEDGDLVIKYAEAGGCKIAVVSCEGMVDTVTVSQLVYSPLQSLSATRLTPGELSAKLQSELLVAVSQSCASSYGELARLLMSGFAAILIDGADSATAIAAQGFKTRSVEKPLIHSNIRSSNEGFTENLRTNVSLVRRRLKTPDFTIKFLQLGELSGTDVSLCWLESKVSPEMLKDAESRLEKIPLSMILESGYVEPFLQERGNSLFTQVGVTDRPDTLAAKLYDGRIAVIVDGSPNALYFPLLLAEHFQTMDDYSGTPVFATFSRWLKYIAFFITLLLPGVFVAMSNFHPELFPPTILSNIMSAEQKTPFSVLPECLIVIIIYEIMREAGLRLPSVVGHAVSIVGGLVLGDIVVRVGLISAPVVLIVALSAITGFILPDLYQPIAVLRIAFVFAGGLLGLFGIAAAGMAVLFKVCAMSSYGVPFTAPLTPFTRKAMRDYFVRKDWRELAEDDFNINDVSGTPSPNPCSGGLLKKSP